jgi:hypothetical protein
MFPLAHAGIPLLPLLASGRMPKGAWLIVLGGLLPDLIDKPLGHAILPENNGRIFAHTLAFALVLFLGGMAFPKVMFLAYGVLSHLILDQVFLDPGAALWPLYGGFEATDFSPDTWFLALKDPLVVSLELVGAAGLGVWALKTGMLKQFIMGSNEE